VVDFRLDKLENYDDDKVNPRIQPCHLTSLPSNLDVRVTGEQFGVLQSFSTSMLLR